MLVVGNTFKTRRTIYDFVVSLWIFRAVSVIAFGRLPIEIELAVEPYNKFTSVKDEVMDVNAGPPRISTGRIVRSFGHLCHLIVCSSCSSRLRMVPSVLAADNARHLLL